MKLYKQWEQEICEEKVDSYDKEITLEEAYKAGAAAKQEEMCEFSEWWVHHEIDFREGLTSDTFGSAQEAYKYWKKEVKHD